MGILPQNAVILVDWWDKIVFHHWFQQTFSIFVSWRLDATIYNPEI